MMCADFKANVWAYALGALEPPERAQMAAHLAERIEHEGCQRDLERAMQLVQSLSSAAPVLTPPDRTWNKIASRIAEERQVRGARVGRKGWVPWALSLAAAAACLVLFVQLRRDRAALDRQAAQLSQLTDAAADRDACRQELEAIRKSSDAQRAALALLELPATQLVTMSPAPASQSSARGTALLNLQARKAVILISALAPAVGKDYELWLIRAGTPLPAGILKPGQDGKVLAEVDPSLLQAGGPEVFAVTVEPPGGSPAPTTSPFLIGSVKG